MAENRLARSLDGLLAQAESILRVHPDLWRDIGLKHNTPERLARDIAAVRETEGRFRAALSAKPQATARRTAVDNAAWDFITRARYLLSCHLGRQYSDHWAPIGFPNYSLRIPQRMDQRCGVLDSLARYFGAHPGHECAGWAGGITAGRATQFHADLLAATAQLNRCRSEIRRTGTRRDQAVAALCRRLRFIKRELRQLLGKDDPRWLAFGLNPPGHRRKRKPSAVAAAPAAPPQPAPVAPPDFAPAKSEFRTPHPALEARSTPALEFEHDREFLAPVLAARSLRRRKRSWLATLFPSWN